jgi:hypothetical protein
MERFIRARKEPCLYLHQFTSAEKAQRIIGGFITRHNTQWLVERLGYWTPTEARGGPPWARVA